MWEIFIVSVGIDGSSLQVFVKGIWPGNRRVSVVGWWSDNTIGSIVALRRNGSFLWDRKR